MRAWFIVVLGIALGVAACGTPDEPVASEQAATPEPAGSTPSDAPSLPAPAPTASRSQTSAPTSASSAAPASEPSIQPDACEDGAPRATVQSLAAEELVIAYETRDADEVARLAGRADVTDPLAAAYSERHDFQDASTWAEAGWAAGDRITLSAVTILGDDATEVLLHVLRRSDALADHDIDGVSQTLRVEFDDRCQMVRIASSGQLASVPDPCRVVDVVPAEGWVTPPGCIDGTGPWARTGHVAAWTGTEVLVAGGELGISGHELERRPDGLAYDPASDRWRAIADRPRDWPWTRDATWTGTELYVTGSFGEDVSPALLSYDPAADQWRTLPPAPETAEQRPTEAVWTGQELLVWGAAWYADPLPGYTYRPSTQRWHRIADPPFPPRWSHTAVWTGAEMIVWGGDDPTTSRGDGAAYDPTTDRWRPLAPATLDPRAGHSAIWTGTEMIVWGGSSPHVRGDGAAYDPAADRWRTLAPAPIPPRHHHTAIWTGAEMIVYGGWNSEDVYGDGAAYDPATDRWRLLPPAPVEPRCLHTATWTGDEMVVYGGSGHCGDIGYLAHGDGAAYDPATDRWRPLPVPAP